MFRQALDFPFAVERWIKNARAGDVYFPNWEYWLVAFLVAWAVWAVVVIRRSR